MRALFHMAAITLPCWLNYFDPTIKIRLRLSVLAASYESPPFRFFPL
jgi:hypothetical protein